MEDFDSAEDLDDAATETNAEAAGTEEAEVSAPAEAPVEETVKDQPEA